MWIRGCLRLLSGACAPRNLSSAEALPWPPDMRGGPEQGSGGPLRGQEEVSHHQLHMQRREEC